MALSLLSPLLQTLKSLIQDEVGLLWGVEKEMKKLSNTFSTIEAVLEDAEQKELQNKAIKDWLRKIKYAAYEVDDILDDCATEVLRWKSEGQSSSHLDKVTTSLLYPFANFIFRHTIAKRMQKIIKDLDAIAEERKKFHLRETDPVERDEFIKSRETFSLVPQTKVYGRDEDIEKIVKVLVEDVCEKDEVSVYPIIGMGGLGKTTLAQIVLDDERVKRHFERRVWVYVSQVFDVKRVLQAAIESVTKKATEALNLESLQRKFGDIFRGKRYLIVLDDVWTDDQDDWDRLKCVLACGSKGASVIVTTRLEKVSLIKGIVPPHHLSFLSENDCLSLFKQRAFGDGDEERQNLVDIGKEIVKKCGGVPLAAKALGGLLHSKSEESEWILVKESEIWNLPYGENDILPALRLSYYNLPLEYRRCFAYCAVFSKGCVIEKEKLVNLWMANGYISRRENLPLTDIGDHIWNELYRRSFFQDKKKPSYDTTLFKMHDLMHDLAQSVMGDECHIMENKSSSSIPKRRIHHITLIGNAIDAVFIPKSVQSVKWLRSIIVQYKTEFLMFSNRSDQVSCDFTKLRSLRAIDANGANTFQLLSSVGKLKHLRFLNLSYAYIRTLPESICSLHNLQTLNLNCCIKLRTLPKNLKDLKSLEHLYLKDCWSIDDTPPKLGELTLLKTLSLFCVGNSGNQRLAELKHMDLGGELCIKHLERVRNPMEAKEANLVGKQRLGIVRYSWSCGSEWESQENVEQLLEALEPHQNVEHLDIRNYKGDQFPLWMRGSTLKNVVSIDLCNFSKCSQLPPLGQFPSLRTLTIGHMDNVEYIDNEFPCARGFLSLETLTIRYLRNLKGLTREEGVHLLPRLRKINIMDCPELTLPHLSSLETLSVYIYMCSNNNLSSISNLNRLTSLSISGHNNVNFFPEEMFQNLTALKDLAIDSFSKLKVLPTSLSSLVSLTSLRIGYCGKLESLPDHGLRTLKSLQHLNIFHCRSLSSLSDSLGNLTALEELNVRGGPKLVALPESIKHLSSLRCLTLDGGSSSADVLSCAELKTLPEALQHVPSLQSLFIYSYPELTSLPEWLGNFTSLQRLTISNCRKIQSLPQSIQRLTKLKYLDVRGCAPELARRCQKDKGEDWDKIAHISMIITVKDDLDKASGEV